MSLVADYGDSSSSSPLSTSDEEESDLETVSPSTKELPKPKLPVPNFKGNTPLNLEDSDAIKSSVFKNPFAEAENAKEAVLEKHIKMVETKGNMVLINGKKICWNYRKGRCRFGHNCKFAHDSDIQKTEEQLQSEKDLQKQQGLVCQSKTLAQPAQILEEMTAGNSQTNQKRKRPGLTQGLVPGKKVMKNYMKQKL